MPDTSRFREALQRVAERLKSGAETAGKAAGAGAEAAGEYLADNPYALPVAGALTGGLVAGGGAGRRATGAALGGLAGYGGTELLQQLQSLKQERDQALAERDALGEVLSRALGPVDEQPAVDARSRASFVK